MITPASARSTALASPPRTDAALKRGVEDALLAGQRRVEQAKVRTYFKTGRLINEHVRVTGGRADYGSHVLERLARDLEIVRTLVLTSGCAELITPRWTPRKASCEALHAGHRRSGGLPRADHDQARQIRPLPRAALRSAATSRSRAH